MPYGAKKIARTNEMNNQNMTLDRKVFFDRHHKLDRIESHRSSPPCHGSLAAASHSLAVDSDGKKRTDG